ncbi:MAG: DUF3106 domain-containing protein [Nitrospirota bacterium]
MRKIFLLTIFFGVFFIQDSSFAEDVIIIGNRARWESMNPEEKKRIIEIYREWKSGPPERREQIKKNYESYRELPPEEKEKLRERFRVYKSLEPSGRKKVEEKLKKVDSLPLKEKDEIEKKYNKMKRKSENEMMKFIERSFFWKSLNEQEREIFRELMFPKD